MRKSEPVRRSVLAIVFLAVFIPLGLLPTFKSGPPRFKCQNPNPIDWIVAANKITIPLEEMNAAQLEITSTAVQVESFQNLRADFLDVFKNIKAIGWTGVALLAALVLNNLIFVRRPQ